MNDLAAQVVGRAYFDLIKAIQSIEIRDCQFIRPVEHHGVANHDRIQPATAAGASGRCAKFAAHVVQHVTDVFVFGHKRTAAHTRGVSLTHSHNLVDHARRHAGTGAGAASRRV